MRKWKDHSAHLIEIKPKKYLSSAQMNIRRVIVDQYKKKYKVDWSYSVLTEDHINLNANQIEKYKMAIEASKHAFAELQLIKRRSKFFRNNQPYLSNVPMINAQHISEEEYKKYVKWGILPTPEQDYDYL